MKLYEKVNYNSNIPYIISNFIREYDISKANINVLLKYKCITQQQYDYFYNLNRNSRQVQIGLLLKKNPKYVTILQKGIVEAKKQFFESNNIKDEDVLCIKNDAIFLINKIPKYTKFDNIEFLCKNTYTSFYKLNRLELYYFFDALTNYEKIDIKGMSKEAQNVHKDHFLEFLLVVFNSALFELPEQTLQIIISFYNKYLNLDVDIEYYRQFDSESRFLLKQTTRYNVYKVDYVQEKDKNSVDISYNLNIIRELYKIFSMVQMRKM